MDMISRIFSFNRIYRIRKQLEKVEAQVKKLKGSDKVLVSRLKADFNRTFIKARFFLILKILFMMIAYASFISAILKSIPFFKFFSSLIVFIGSIVGVTFALLGIIFCNQMINIYINDSLIIASRLTAIYEKNR